MSNPSELKSKVDLSTLNLILFSLVTLGIYPFVWMSDVSRSMAEVTGKRICSRSFIIWNAVVYALSDWIYSFSDSSSISSLKTYIVASLVLGLASWALSAVYAFRARAILRAYAASNFCVDLKMNAFLLVLLNVLYVNYKINELPEVVVRETTLRQMNTTAAPGAAE